MWLIEISEDTPVSVDNLRIAHGEIFDSEVSYQFTYMSFCVFEHGGYKVFRFYDEEEDDGGHVVAIGCENESDLESLLLFCENLVGICNNWVELFSQAAIALG